MKTAVQLNVTLHALADPTRRAILEQLQGRSLSVSELADPYDMSLNAISKHIKVLERGGLIRRTRQGRTHHLSANPAGLDAAANWIDQMRAVWTSRFDALAAVLDADEAHIQARNEERENG